MTSTLLAGVLIGRLGLPTQFLKAMMFLLFLFAVGYGVGPQFVRGIAKDGVPQALFAVAQCVLSLLVPYAIVRIVGYDLGYAADFTRGRRLSPRPWVFQRTPSTGLALAAEDAKRMIDSMPIAYAVTYLFGT